MKVISEKILLGALFIGVISPLTLRGQSSLAPTVSEIESAGFEDYYIELNVNGFNESEQTYKGIIKLIEHVDERLVRQIILLLRFVLFFLL